MEQVEAEMAISGFSKEARELRKNISHLRFVKKRMDRVRPIVDAGVKTHNDVGVVQASALNVAEIGYNAVQATKVFFAEFPERSRRRIDTRLARKFAESKAELSNLSMEAEKLAREVQAQTAAYQAAESKEASVRQAQNASA